MRIVEARASVRDLIRKEIGMSVGEVNRRISIDDALAASTLASSGGTEPGSPGAHRET
jgi:hypothetical protein